jgi:hypothetical protein
MWPAAICSLAVKTSTNCWVLNGREDRVPSIRNYVGYLRD